MENLNTYLTATQINEIANTVFEQYRVTAKKHAELSYNSVEYWENEVQQDTALMQHSQLKAVYYAMNAEDSKDDADPYWEHQTELAQLDAEKHRLMAKYARQKMEQVRLEK